MSEDKKLIEMNEHELHTVIGNYREKARKAEMMGIVNEYEVWQRKALIAESYLIDTDKIEIGKVYQLIGAEKAYFKVERIKGVFAWGFRFGSELSEEGIPVALLQIDQK